MTINAVDILSILDRCCDACTFPMLDNSYIYLAATRLSLFRSKVDWAIVIEVFGFSPRAGLPDTCIQTFASHLHDRNSLDNYVSREAYENYLAYNPHNESRCVGPIQPGDWQDEEDLKFVADGSNEVFVREKAIELPSVNEYTRCGINLEQSSRVQVFELCRFLAGFRRDQVLATPQERRASILPNLEQILQLEEWHHPNVVDQDERPSGSETFQQIAKVLATGNVDFYHPSQPPNTHWRNWPEGGSL